MGSKGFYAMFRTKEDLSKVLLREQNETRIVTRQQTLDEVCLALKEAFDFTPEMFTKFKDAWYKAHLDVCETVLAEAKDDPDIVYAWALFDRAIEDAVGAENFVPYTERYRLDNKTDDYFYIISTVRKSDMKVVATNV